MSEWKEVKLKEVCVDIAYGYTASAKIEPVGPKFLRITDLRNGYIDWDQVPYCSISDSDHHRYKLQVGDICIARTGASTGASTVIKHDIDAVFASYLIRFKVDEQIADPFFVGYILKSHLFKQYVNGILGGSAQPNANAQQFGNFAFSLPPLPVQRRIAQILGRLDDKIEVNRRINRTLEAMARALYRHWFVDFGPFQDGPFVESELGLIPRGWEVRTVYSLADYVNGMAFKPKDLSPNPDDGLPVIKISELNRGFPNSTTRYYGGEYKSKYELATGDVLFAWSASLGIYLWTHGKALLNQHIFNVRPNGSLSKATLYFLLKHVIDEFVAIAAARRTTMGHIKKSHLQEKLVAIPPASVLQQINPKFDRLFQMVLATEIESQRLTTTRDYLLPRLLSGEVEVTPACAASAD